MVAFSGVVGYSFKSFPSLANFRREHFQSNANTKRNMNKEILQRLMDVHISALFPGIEVKSGSGNSLQRKQAVFSRGQSEIRIKEVEGTSFLISRAQPFTSQELQIINDIVSITEEYSDLPFSTQIHLSGGSLGRMVARSLTTSDANDKYQGLISFVVETLEKWSAQTYEGSRIASSIGIDPATGSNESQFEVFAKEDFAKVISNGYDTLVEFDQMGGLRGHKALDTSSITRDAPFRYSAFSAYTENSEKLAFVLNRNGEILVFKNGALFFAKRRGEWKLFTHKSIIKQLAFGSRKTLPSLQDSVYESALDVSFARCGGCICVVQKSRLGKFLKSSILKPEDILKSKSNAKTYTLLKSIGANKFQNLDRRIRQEMLGIDGATILDHEGSIITAGAILNISQENKSSATGGARLAAARELSKYGLSLKISADGEIRAIGNEGGTEFRFG